MSVPVLDAVPDPALATATGMAPGPSPADSVAPRGRKVRERPTFAQLGLNRLAWRLIWVQLAFLAVSGPLYPLVGLSIAWPTTVPFAMALVLVAAAWVYHAYTPGRSSEWIVAEAIAVTFLLVSLTTLAAPAQYAAIGLKLPLVDGWLAAADARLGVNVMTLAAWTHAHKAVSWTLTLSYLTLPVQLIMPMFVLGMMKRDRLALWEFCFHYHFCLIVAIVSLALLPAFGAPNFYGFTPTLDQVRFSAQLLGVRAGTFTVVRFDDLEGLICLPSFHAAAGLMVTWCFRRYRPWVIGLSCLNALMILATFMSGAHYFIDVVGTFVLFPVSVLVYRRWVAPLLG